MKTIAEYIPSKVRGVIYAVIGTFLLLDPIWNIIPEGYGGKVTATLAVLGFGMATLNTDLVPKPADDVNADRGESAVVTLAAVAVIVVAVVWLLSVYR